MQIKTIVKYYFHIPTPQEFEIHTHIIYICIIALLYFPLEKIYILFPIYIYIGNNI